VKKKLIGQRGHWENGAAMLVQNGPLVTVSWAIPENKIRALALGGKPVPAAVSGTMLIDTGASQTCIDIDIAEELGLDVVGRRSGFGFGGHHTSPVYNAVLLIPAGDVVLAHSRTVMGIREMQAHFAKTNPDFKRQGLPTRMVGLLGRDLMSIMEMTYDGPRARWQVKFADDFVKSAPRPQ